MKRNTTIDVAKGIAISLMVIGHCYSSNNIILTTIYSFHMPFFFIVSGMLYAEKWKNGVTVNALILCRRLLVPYFIFDTLFSLFILVLGRSENLASKFINIIFRTILPMVGKTVTWFLPCQFFVVILAALFIKVFHKCKYKIDYILFALFYILAIFTKTTNTYLLVAMRVFVGMGFFAVGYYSKSLIVKPIKCITIVFWSSIFIVLSLKNGMVSLVMMVFSNPILYTVNGCLGTYMLYQVCLKLWTKKNRFLTAMIFLGQNTIIILCTHMFVIECIRLLDYKLLGNALYHFGVFEGFLFGVIVLVVMVGIIEIFNRYFGNFFGNIKKG